MQTVDDVFDIENDTMVGYHGSLSTVIIPEGVKKCKLKEIGAGSFQSLPRLERVTVKSGSIGEFVFFRCPSLKEVIIGEGVKAIRLKDGTVIHCNALYVNRNENVEELGSYKEVCAGLDNLGIENEYFELLQQEDFDEEE